MRLLPWHLLCMHAECACCRGACYARRMRLLPWYLLCTPNAPAAVVPAMHAKCACCRGTCYARRMRLLMWHLLCTPNAPATCASESRTKRIHIFPLCICDQKKYTPTVCPMFLPFNGGKGFCLSLALSSTHSSFTNSSITAIMFYVMLLWCA